jgi:hypothetical protein
MKHIKTFESHIENEMTEDIKDICLELEDKGLIVSLISEWDYKYILVTKGCELPVIMREEFDYEDVREVMDRLKDYIGDRFISIWVKKYNNLVRLDGASGIEASNKYGRKQKLNDITGVKLKYEVIE